MTNRIVLPVAAMLALGATSALVAQDRSVRDDRIANPPSVRIDFDHAGSAYSWGQPMRVRFSTDRDAFVMVASVSQDGQLTVLYPRTPVEQAAVFGNSEYVVTARPWSGVAGSASGGTYGYVFAIASDEPLDLSRFASRTGRTWLTSYFQFARYGTARPEAERMIDQVADEVLFDRQVHYGYDLRYFVVEGTHFYSTRSCWGLYCSRYDAGWSSYCASMLFGFAFDIGITPWECLYQRRYQTRRLAYGRPTYPRPNTPNRPDKPRDGMPVPPVSGLKPDTVHWIVPDSTRQSPQNRTQPAKRPTITIVAQDEPDTAGFGDSRRLRDSNDDGRLGGAPLNRRGVRPEIVALDSPLEPVTGRSTDAMPRVYRPSPVEQGKPRVVHLEPAAPDEARSRDDPRILRPERADDGSRVDPRAERADLPTVVRPERERPEPARREERRAEPAERERPARVTPIERRAEEPRVERPRQEPTRVERPRQEPTRVERPRQEPARVERPRREPTRVERARTERPSVERRSSPPPRRVEPPPTRKP